MGNTEDWRRFMKRSKEFLKRIRGFSAKAVTKKEWVWAFVLLEKCEFCGIEVNGIQN
jgi:hypothetical protein